MAGFFSKLFGGGKNDKKMSAERAALRQQRIDAMIDDANLFYRASHSFNNYLTDFIKTGNSVGLPAGRLSRDEWDTINKKIAKYNVKLVLRYDNNIPYMRFERATGSDIQSDNSNMSPLEQLMMRASKNFKQHQSDFMNGVSSPMFPTARMSSSEWDELNRLIADQGIRFVPTTYKGISYMAFSHIAHPGKGDNNASAFQSGTAAVKEKAYAQIKQKYPNLSDQVVRHIVEHQNEMSWNDIYQMVRHAMQPYDTPMNEFVAATQYGSKSTSDIGVFSYQDWTWSRRAKHRVQRDTNPVGYHLSLNVHVTPGLIAALDDVLARDMGQHIDYYKFPKANYFDEIQYRHDPVTIYTYDRDSNTEAQIVAAVAPYVRSNEGLLGHVLGRGVDISPETSVHGGLSVGQSIAVNIRGMLDSIRE